METSTDPRSLRQDYSLFSLNLPVYIVRGRHVGKRGVVRGETTKMVHVDLDGKIRQFFKNDVEHIAPTPPLTHSIHNMGFQERLPGNQGHAAGLTSDASSDIKATISSRLGSSVQTDVRSFLSPTSARSANDFFSPSRNNTAITVQSVPRPQGIRSTAPPLSVPRFPPRNVVRPPSPARFLPPAPPPAVITQQEHISTSSPTPVVKNTVRVVRSAPRDATSPVSHISLSSDTIQQMDNVHYLESVASPPRPGSDLLSLPHGLPESRAFDRPSTARSPVSLPLTRDNMSIPNNDNDSASVYHDVDDMIGDNVQTRDDSIIERSVYADRLRSQQRNFERQLRQHRDIRRDQQIKLTRAKEESKVLHGLLQSLNVTLSDLRNDNKNLSEEISNLRAFASTSVHDNTELDRLRAEVTALRKRDLTEDGRASLDALREENAYLLAQTSHLSSLMAEIDRLRSEKRPPVSDVADLRSSIADLEHENERLRQQFNDVVDNDRDAELEDLRRDKNNLSRQHEQASTEAVNLRSERDSLLKEITRLRDSSSERQQPIDVAAIIASFQESNRLQMEAMAKQTLQQMTVLRDKKRNPEKMKFPKFHGKSSEEFEIWYPKFLSVLATPDWDGLYNPATQDIVADDAVDPELSKYLYSGLSLCLEDDAQEMMSGKDNLRTLGVSFLNTLRDAFRKKLSEHQKEDLDTDFKSLSRPPTESVHVYAARCTRMRRKLLKNGIACSQERLHSKFIMGLGPGFTEIRKIVQNGYELPREWRPLDIEQLVPVAELYLDTAERLRKDNAEYKEAHRPPVQTKPNDATPDQAKSGDGKKNNAVKKKGENDQKKTNNDNKKSQTITKEVKDRRIRIYRALRSGDFNLQTFRARENVPADTCVFHGWKHCRDATCNDLARAIETVRTEQRQLLERAGISSSQPTIPSHLHNNPYAALSQQSPTTQSHTPVAQQTLSNIPIPEVRTDQSDVHSAITELDKFNTSLSGYFPLSLNVDLSTLPKPSSIHKSYVIDSGAYPTMSNDADSFVLLVPWPKEFPIQHVVMADGSGACRIAGFGVQRLRLSDNMVLEYRNSLYVPDLMCSLYSVPEHMNQDGCYFHAENGEYSLAFPSGVLTGKGSTAMSFVYTPTRDPPTDIITGGYPDAVRLSSAFATSIAIDSVQSRPTVSFDLLSGDAILPAPSQGAECEYHIASPRSCTLAPYQTVHIRSQLSTTGLPGHVGIVSNYKHCHQGGFDVLERHYISGHSSTIILSLRNNSWCPIYINKGDVIASIKFENKNMSRNDMIPLNSRDAIFHKSTDLSLESSDTSVDHDPLDKVTIPSKQQTKDVETSISPVVDNTNHVSSPRPCPLVDAADTHSATSTAHTDNVHKQPSFLSGVLVDHRGLPLVEEVDDDNTDTNHVQTTTGMEPMTLGDDIAGAPDDITQTDAGGPTPRDGHTSSRTLPWWFTSKTRIMWRNRGSRVWSRGFIDKVSPTETTFYEGRSRRHSTPITKSNSEILAMIRHKDLLHGHHHLVTGPQASSPLANLEPLPLPKIPVTEHVLMSSNKMQSITVTQLQRSFGYRDVSTFVPHLHNLYQPTFHISSTDREPILSLGETSTVPRTRSNSVPLDLPQCFGDTVHCDIVFGSRVGISGTKYALLFVDRGTRCKFVYPLKDLKKDILPSFKQLVSDLGFCPRRFISDCDKKLFGKAVRSYLVDKKSSITATPGGRQSQNGLCEANWKTIVKMARAWMASALLPPQFWWYAVKRACEVSNYAPIRIDGVLTTPFEQAYRVKPDLRNLVPMFSVAYLRRYRDADTQRSWESSQSIRAICVGRSQYAKSLLFYHPPSQKTLHSDDFVLDETLAAGPAFDLPYEGGLFFNKYEEINDLLRPSKFAPEQRVHVKSSDKVTAGTIITVPAYGELIYTIKYDTDGSLHQHHENCLHSTDPTITPEQRNLPLTVFPKWIKNGSPCTLFRPEDKRPRHGSLIESNGKWFFKPGRKSDATLELLPDFVSRAYYYVRDLVLFEGHPKFERLVSLRQSRSLSTAVANHVSAAGLKSHDVPTLIQHKSLASGDREIWDAAYKEEFDGLADLPCWVTITHKEYLDLRQRHGHRALPTMAVSTIKYDEHGQPKRAKYRIVALGNLENYNWEKSDTYAPVLSLMELRLLTALAVRNRRTLKSGDVKQAFCQASLPPDEKYVLRPPPGCPFTPPNSYWLLKRTLYGLRRSPRHWFDRATEILRNIGLQPLPNAPCIFTGALIPGEPPLYLGMYVDDFVYFSKSPAVEKRFEELFGDATDVDFMGQVSHFLGIRFQWRHTEKMTSAHLSQAAFTEALINQCGLDVDHAVTKETPYRSGRPVDNVPHIPMSPENRYDVRKHLQSLVGSLNWLSQGTRPDISTITSLLSQHQANPSPGHVAAAKFAVRYLKGTKDLGISFHSNQQLTMGSFVHFPVDKIRLSGMSDANWGPQHAKIPSVPSPPVPLWTSRSMSGHLISLHGPLHWSSKRQTVTARSSAEAEIYATDECVKDILFLRNIITDLGLADELLDKTTPILNDNMACVLWSKNRTSRAIRHIQIRENAVRESVHGKIVKISHVNGADNLSDIFTKEDKDTTHYKRLRDHILSPPFANAVLPKFCDNSFYTLFPSISTARAA